MASPSIIHIIGTTAFIIVLIMVTAYVFASTGILIKENEDKNMGKILDSLRLQLQYVLEVNTNMSTHLNYPLYVIGDRPYNIYVGSGDRLENQLGLNENLTSDEIILLIRDPANGHYKYIVIAENSSSYPIFLNKNPIVFSSTLIIYVEKIVTSQYMILSFNVEGRRA